MTIPVDAAVEDGVMLYEKCLHCHFFIDTNDAWSEGTPGVAKYVHLTRGDEADEAWTEGHDATPSGMVATLSVWKDFGPDLMRARFTGTVSFDIAYSPDLTTPLKVRQAIEPALQQLYGFVSLLHIPDRF